MNLKQRIRFRNIVYTFPNGRVVFRETREGNERTIMAALGAIKWHVTNTTCSWG